MTLTLRRPILSLFVAGEGADEVIALGSRYLGYMALLYALPDHEGSITEADKQTDSPYNLYKYAGLPPTPIANPGLASIQAALEPDNTNYYYYALGKDGVHHFFTNYADHLAFVKSSDYAGN